MDKKVYEFISKQTQDPILERRTCEITGQEFPIFQGDKDMLDKLSPVIGGKKYPLPLPTLCPEERQRRRMGADNLTNLYKRKCDFSGKMVISRFRPEIPVKIYEQRIRWSDQRDGLQYGRPMDFTRSFFDQCKELYFDVPKFNVTSNFLLDKNSDYTNYAGSNKNCYFTFGADFNEDCYYDLYVKGCKNCVGNFYIFDSEHCYGGTDVSKSFAVMYSRNCQQCRHSYFLENCVNCEYCIGCKNLVNQKYCIRNTQVTKEEYDQCVQQYFSGSKTQRDEFQKKFQAFSLQYPNKATMGTQNENSIGNALYNTKNAVCCFDMNETENARYCYFMTVGPNKNCMDVSSFGIGIERIYNSGSIGYNVQNARFSEQANENCSDIFYSRELFYCHNCFGCVGLKNKEYCILNKQYTQQEYEQLVPQIIDYLMKIGERGDFFPMTHGPFAYNELVANSYFPLTKEEVLKRGLLWLDEKPEINIPADIEKIKASELPDHIKDVDDAILNKIILCEESGRPFILQKGELDFYRQHNIPLPTKHPDIRFHEGLAARPGKLLYSRICDHCQQETVSVYSEESGYKVWCEACYNKEIYG